VARFEAERRLRSLQRYADFFESAADGIVVLDQDGRLLFSNPRASDITGYDGPDLTGRKLGEIFAPEDQHVARELREGFLKGQYPTGIDVRVRRKDGTTIVLSLAFSSVLREEGVVLCNFRDVTIDRAVAAELSKTKDLLQRIIDSSLDAIISADVEGRVLVFNRAAERIYGRTTAEMVGADVRALYASGGAQRIMALLRAGGGRIEGVRTEILNASGELVPVSLSASLLKEGDRARIRIVPSRLQDVPLATFEALESNDILFIDSTHVGKTGSDVNHLFFEILPRLASGVHVHVHDIFYPFEYPKEWVYKGRAWNEAYMTRAFLQYNAAFRIALMNTFMQRFHADFFREKMPLCLRNPGGSLWLRRE